ncbi:hypothetical protein BH18CHL2_BH18CHL2_00710 [soil metagenome]
MERKVRLDGTAVEFACEALLIEPGRRAVLRYVSDRDRFIGEPPLAVPAGTVTIAHYWSDRPYNVYHFLADGRTLAFYVNVADQTDIRPDGVSYRDLVVDVLLRPSGAIDVLDEDELPADLEPGARKAIAGAVEALVTNGRRLAAEIERESAPFRALE